MTLSPLTFSAKAADLNLPGLTGTINTTVSSGFSIRAEDMDCMLQDGRDVSHMPTGVTSRTGASGFSDATYSLNTKWGFYQMQVN